jgi:tetratricopeptide (TPR) repeat protein
MPQLHKNIGDLYYQAARYDDAFDAFERAVKTHPDLGEDVYVKLGDLYMRRHTPQEAARCWERALELDPANERVRAQLESLKQAR